MQVYKSDYLQINYYSQLHLLELVWLPATEEISVEDYKNEHVELLKQVLETNSTRVLAQTQELKFVITPQIQEWMNENIFLPAIQKGFNRLSVVVSKEFLFSFLSSRRWKKKKDKKYRQPILIM